MKYKAECNVTARNNLGQFIRDIEQAGEYTTRDMVQEGARISRRLAPVGPRPDRRTIPLKESIFWQMLSSTRGMWGASARHAVYVEKGTRPHTMIADPSFLFFWEAAGRMWIPGLLGEPDIINHPGAEAQPFLEPALVIVMSKWRQIAKRHYRNG